jgi:putative spermidine/putrescine transport system permease protein
MITIPWTVRLLTASLAGFDRSIEEAAQNLGATPLQAFVRITLPVIKPGVVAGGALRLHHLVRQPRDDAVPRRPWPDDTADRHPAIPAVRIDPTIAAVSLLQIVLIGAGMLVTDRYVKLTRVL